MRARAPGKMILSGEHAVAYGADALAVAVQQYTTVEFTPVSQSKAINTVFSGISTGARYPLSAISRLKHKFDRRYESFTNGEIPIQKILSDPNDLVMYAMSTMMHHLPSRKELSPLLPESGILRSESDIPTGAGMGSSASAIAATLVLYEDILEKPLTVQQRFDYVRFCERLQHGNGSAIDAACVTFGGANLLRERERYAATIDLDQHWYWLHTGTPTTSTGECVAFVRKHYGKDQARWDAFTDTTRALEQALQTSQNPSEMIRDNHCQLQAINVVPAKVSALIDDIESLGGSAKISGAGAIAGDQGGLVLMYLPKPRADVEADIVTLNEKHRYYIQDWGTLRISEHGAHRLDDAVSDAV